MTAQRNKQKKQTKAELEQADSSTLTPPVEPPDPKEADMPTDASIAEEEAKLRKLQAQAKAIKERLAARKKQRLGGAKLDKKRAWVPEPVAWVLKPRVVDAKGNTEKRGGLASQFVLAVERANDAIQRLADYEAKLELPDDERQADKWADKMATATEAAEVLRAMTLDVRKAGDIADVTGIAS